MNINSLSSSNWFQQLEAKFMSAISPPAASAETTTSSSADSVAPSANTTSAPAAATPTLPSNQFAPDVLSALISAQSAPPSSAQVAQGLISTLDSNGDGSLSLSEITNALGNPANPGTSQTGASSDLSAAFAKLDTNGDGQLSASELASALDTATQNASQSGQTQGAHHHHHHHHSDAGQAANQTTSASGSNPTSEAATTETLSASISLTPSTASASATG
jgi:hypothetical protein